MGSIAFVDGGRTICDPRWGQAGWIDGNQHKIYVVVAGSARYAIPGHDLPLTQSHIYLIPGGRPHRFSCAGRMEVFWLHLRLASPALERRLTACDRIRAWDLADWNWWQPVWEGIPAWMERRDLEGELRQEAFAAALCADAIAGQEAETALDPRLDAAVRWMEAHCLEHPALEAAARIAGLAPSVFQRRFTAAVGDSPRSWMEARRLDHACRLLRQAGTSVQEVAGVCGYANQFHFSRVMRRRLGASPQRLRRRWAAGEP